MVKAFFHSGFLLKSLNHTFISLSPKVPTPERLTQFRPISLCNVSYKIISKILVNRLKPLMDSLITPFQNAFIQGRQITDNIILAHEVFEYLKKKRKGKWGFVALKLDMNKAYDRINWPFLTAVLMTMGFRTKWITWVSQYVHTVSYSLLLNGSPTETFKPNRGLRQGDPLSPYLFLMCANILSCALLKQENLHNLKGIKIGRSTQPLTHLLFADDSFLFFKNDNKSIMAIQSTLAWYCSLSGQSLNLDKSELYCSLNLTTQQKTKMAQDLGVKLVSQPSKYLGVNFKLRGNRIADFQDLIHKISSKLQGWKAKLLSQAGRLTLINSVFNSIPICTFSVFKVPETVCKKLDSLINAFWWGHDSSRRKMHMTNWETITKPKTQGGLGIKKFGPMNKALITKQYWRIRNNPNLLLSKTLKSKYCPNGDLHSHKPNPKASWIWRTIMGQDNPKLRQASWRVGRGYNIPISHPAWFKFKPNAPPHLQDQITTVADLIDQRNASWKANLITQLYDKPDSDQIMSVTIPVVETNAAPDKLIWPHSLNGEYQVKKAYEILTHNDNVSGPPSTNNTHPTVWKHLWKIKLPQKILTFT
jgi:hypothetical protein